MFDYGIGGQIGFGQNEAQYFESLSKVLRDLIEIAAPHAVLWLVVGALRRKGRLLDIPGRVIALAEESGWVFREDITWNKGKAMPWTKHGELRGVTERVLLLTRDAEYKFDVESLRNSRPNSLWWRRYPERYSPRGARPTNVWEIPIPTQGSWGTSRLHFCPFPPELVYRALSLTTQEGDVVLDPFAGIGSVPAMASGMGRVGYGLELSGEYVKALPISRELADTFLNSLDAADGHRETFETTIRQLRMLKFAKLLGAHLVDAQKRVKWIQVKSSRRRPMRPYSEIAADFVICGDEGTDLLAEAERAANRVPMSKFGIDARFSIGGRVPAGISWWPSGRFWLPPQQSLPVGEGPHVGASFVPNVDLVDDLPYA